MWKRRIQPKIGQCYSVPPLRAIVTAPYKRDADDMVIGGKGEAGNLYRLMHHMFTMAIAWKLTIHSKAPAPEPMVRRLSPGGNWIRTCMGHFPVKWLFSVLCQFFVRSGKGPFFIPSPTIRFPERAEWVKGPKR